MKLSSVVIIIHNDDIKREEYKWKTVGFLCLPDLGEKESYREIASLKTFIKKPTNEKIQGLLNCVIFHFNFVLTIVLCICLIS